MKTMWPKVRLGEVLRRSEETVALEPDAIYREVTVKLWGKGVVLRGLVTGVEIASARRFVARSGQFILSRIDARNGAIGVVPPELDGAVVTNDFPLFNLNHDRLDPGFLGWLGRTRGFVELCMRASEGTTNRVRLQEDRFLALEIPLPPLAEQRRVVARIEELAAQIHEARTLRGQAAEETDALIESARMKFISESDGKDQLFDSLVEQLRGASGLPLKEYQQGGRFPVIDQGQQFIGGYCDDESRLLHIASPVVVWGDHTTNVKLVDFDFVPGADGTKVFQPNETITASFLFQVLKAVEFPDMGYSRHYRFLRDVPIKIPPLPEQRRIVAELDALQVEVDALKELQRQTSKELDALLPAVLDRAFKGEM